MSIAVNIKYINIFCLHFARTLDILPNIAPSKHTAKTVDQSLDSCCNTEVSMLKMDSASTDDMRFNPIKVSTGRFF